MSVIRNKVVSTAINKSYSLINYNILNDIHKQFKFIKQTVLADKSLTEDEKFCAIKILIKIYDRNKILYNGGKKRICQNCNQECLAILYCEYCVRNYLKTKFLNWTSGNNDIDNLIQKCQMETFHPEMIIEWIPYNNLQNIKYLTKGGFSEIYTASWIDGSYGEWDSKRQQLIKRFGREKVVLKKLGNVESANQRWFEEIQSHLTLSNKSSRVVKCYGLTQDPSDGSYMLVIRKMTVDLRTYLQQNHDKLTWKEKILITVDIIDALKRIHKENAIHRDLHSGNILYSQSCQQFKISDLGFCGPINKSSKSIYGNLPYIAPEVIYGNSATKTSDVYSIAMLMWEISSGQPPFPNYEHDYYLAMSIINGIRPKFLPGTPLGYKSLIEQCWNADPLKRPSIRTLQKRMDEINLLQSESTQSEIKKNNDLKINSSKTNYTNSILLSKIHQFDQFENFPEPRNATEEEQEAFHSNRSYNFHIPDNIDDLDKSSSQKSNITSKINRIFKVNSKKLSKMLKNSKSD